MVLTLLRATSRKAFGSFVTRKITFNHNDGCDHDDNKQQKGAPDEKSYQCRLESFINFQRMVFQSIGIFGSLVLIGTKCHTDCIRVKTSANFNIPHDNRCSFLDVLNKNLPDIRSHSYNQLNVLPLHILPDSSSSCENNESKPKNAIKDDNVIDKILQNMKHEMDVFADEFKNVKASMLLYNKRVDEAINLLKSCPNSAKAMFNLGIVYESGQHDPINGIPNYTNALKYYTNAAHLGHSLAHYNLALIYLYGKKPIQADPAKGMSLLHRAAELGVEEAINFVREQSAVRSEERDLRIRRSQELFDQIKKTNNNNNFHTSQSSPNFLTSIIGFLKPSIKDLPPKQSSMIDDELLSSSDEAFYDSDDSLEIVFSDE